MLVNSTREQYYDLCSKARYHMERYYNDDAPEISDFEFDTLKSEIAEIEKLHPEWITSSSPTQFVAKREASFGYVLVFASSWQEAIKTFKNRYPNRPGSDCVNCSFMYDAKDAKELQIELKQICHDIIWA